MRGTDTVYKCLDTALKHGYRLIGKILDVHQWLYGATARVLGYQAFQIIALCSETSVSYFEFS